MNNTQLIGRFVRDHNAVTTGNGTFVLKNTLAVDHPYKKDDSSFISLVFFGKTGELANQYTGKGSQVAVTGHIQTGKYTKDDGTTVYTTDVIVNQIKFLDSKKDSQQNEQPQYSAPIQQPVENDVVNPDDLPF